MGAWGKIKSVAKKAYSYTPIGAYHTRVLKPAYDWAKGKATEQSTVPDGAPQQNQDMLGQDRARSEELYRRSLAGADRSYQAGDMSQGVNLARDAAMGNAPSAAQAQYQAALMQASQQRQSAIAGARGTDRGAMRLQAIQAEGEQNAMGAQHSAALRANEMATGRAQYMQALDAQEAANRGAFSATSQSQQGYLGAGANASGQGLDATGLAYKDATERERIRVQDQERIDNRNMGYVNSLGKGVASAYGG